MKPTIFSPSSAMDGVHLPLGMSLSRNEELRIGSSKYNFYHVFSDGSYRFHI